MCGQQTASQCSSTADRIASQSSAAQRTWQKMRMPVGLCMRSTAVSTLFTFWPPAPLARAVVSSMSCGREGRKEESECCITVFHTVANFQTVNEHCIHNTLCTF